ncbi:MAG: DUF3179 domain-containing (seleno)protein [Planctomycetota bacterium]|nr:DUF3179 domain-containing (seleno)protein [Planctomycetota bacterium]
MSETGETSPDLRPTPKGPLRFREGGWLLLLAGVITLALLAWGLAPAIFRMADRPPGDGKDITSYAFDLSNPRLPLNTIEPAMLHRDMAPVEFDPGVLSPKEVAEANQGRRRYLVSDDLVIGVEIEGHARAYPLSILNVHEVINDRIHDIPLAITWHWPSGASRVFDRRVGDTELALGISGLVAGGNQLLYPRRNDNQRGEEPLVSQVLGISITGPELTFTPVPHELVPWSDWLARHPKTTVAKARPELKDRYKKGKPDTWFASSKLMFKTPPPTMGPPPKSHMLLLRGSGGTTIVALDDLVETAGDSGVATVQHAGSPIQLAVTSSPSSARILSGPEDLEAMRILWISGHALVPEAGKPVTPSR